MQNANFIGFELVPMEAQKLEHKMLLCNTQNQHNTKWMLINWQIYFIKVILWVYLISAQIEFATHK